MRMKYRIFFPLAILCVTGFLYCKTPVPATREPEPAAGDNSRNSLDWPGSYFGVLPCGDCAGIETTITIRKDLTCSFKRKYLGKTDLIVESSGTFSWDTNGGIILISEPGIGTGQERYLVGENQLIRLDMQGNRITGDLAGQYILGKVNTDLLEKYWKLTELNGKDLTAGPAFTKEPHVMFKLKGNRVTGNGGCNSFSGTYELKSNNRITLSKLMTTLMACPAMDTESLFLKALQMADSYYVRGDTLILNRARMAPLARFQAVYK
jgi:copper homeostasis protein (lipoprotein)